MAYTKEQFEADIGHRFLDRQLLRSALTHSSYAGRPEDWPHNERLEYLGDAVVELAVSDWLYNHIPPLPEGQMTQARAQSVCEAALAGCARQIRLGELLYLGRGEELTHGREKNSILSDAFEALVGALYQDAGFDFAKDFVLRAVGPLLITALNGENQDCKTQLQERLKQLQRGDPEYVILSSEGPSHRPVFTAAVEADGQRLGLGQGGSKKEAEQAAAAQALEKLAELTETKG
ncbi:MULTISPECIES: ribonuclease III [unclassified Clostridium]|uniref:ribonuclease III n=1 Tax=unclassified Clostridium TaxID=2614128 RepID=UPI0011069163|nr:MULTISPECIES: ribonuclease III [unclassified Clostridium]